MRLIVKSMVTAAVFVLSGAELADARGHKGAPIEYAHRNQRPPEVEPARPISKAAQSAAARRAAPATIDFADMLYGYGRSPARRERPILDVRDSLEPAPRKDFLEIAALEEPSSTRATQLPKSDRESQFAAVDLSPVEHPEPPSGAPSQSPVPSGYFIQVGAFADPANVGRVRAALADLGPITVDQRETGTATLHRVRLGQWATRPEAELALEMIVGRGLLGARLVGGP